MKRNLLILLILVSVIISCGDESTTPTFKKEDFIGKTWVRYSTSIAYDPVDCNSQGEELLFTEDDLTLTVICDGRENVSLYPYTFSGNQIDFTAEGLDVSLIIKSLDTAKLTLDWKYNGTTYGTTAYNKE